MEIFSVLLALYAGNHQWIPLAKTISEQTIKKQTSRRWFEKPSRSVWRHYNAIIFVVIRDTGGCLCNKDLFPTQMGDVEKNPASKFFSPFHQCLKI